MKSLILISITLCFLNLTFAQVGKVGINTTSPTAMLHVKDSSVVFTGPSILPNYPGNPPVSGAGIRMMWYPDKGAFRCGRASGNDWNKDSIGDFSLAIGEGVKAKGFNAIALGASDALNISDVAIGFSNIASGGYSTAFGINCNAMGNRSTALGSESTATGFVSLATGSITKATGSYSFSGGLQTHAKSFSSFVIGRYNDTTATSTNAWIATDPLFVVANGANNSSRSNALTILKNGNVGIGTVNPGFPLNFANQLGVKISLWGNSGNYFGFGIQPSLMQIHTSASNEDIAFGYGSSSSFTEKVRFKGNGNVGIGTSTPGFPLNFASTTGDKISLWGNSGAHFGFGIQTSLLQIHTDNNLGDIAFGYGSSASFTERVRFKGNGNVGIATSTPGFPLSFASTLGDKIALWGNSGATYGFGIQSNALQIHSDISASDIVFGYGSSAALTETMRIRGNGNVGIATSSPEFKLDINGRMRLRNSADGTPGTWYNNSDNSAAVSFIGMLNDSHIGIYSGLGAAWNFLMNLTNGNIGIGITPTQKLHVNGAGLFNGNGLFNGIMTVSKAASGATWYGNSVGQFENNTTAYINILTPEANESGLVFGNPAHSAHGGIYYNSGATPNGLQFRTNLSAIRMVVNNAGLVGIGTTSPTTKLHVRNGISGTASFPTHIATFENDDDAYISMKAPDDESTGLYFHHPSDSGAIIFNQGNIPDGFRFKVGTNTIAMTINQFGHVGIGTSIQQEALEVSGNGKFSKIGLGFSGSLTERLHVTGNGVFSGTVTASCGVLSCSDLRYKTNIQPITNSLSHVLSLRGIYYHWDKEKFPEKEFDDKRHLGFAAQEIEKLFPEMVHTDPEGYKTVDYSRMTPVLLEAIKEQQLLIDHQNAKLENQQAQIDFLMKELNILKEKTNSYVSREP